MLSKFVFLFMLLGGGLCASRPFDFELPKSKGVFGQVENVIEGKRDLKFEVNPVDGKFSIGTTYTASEITFFVGLALIPLIFCIICCCCFKKSNRPAAPTTVNVYQQMTPRTQQLPSTSQDIPTGGIRTKMAPPPPYIRNY